MLCHNGLFLKNTYTRMQHTNKYNNTINKIIILLDDIKRI